MPCLWQPDRTKLLKVGLHTATTSFKPLGDRTMSINAQREAALLASVPTGLLINGEWRPAASGKTFEVEDPATGKVLLSIADAGPEDGKAALDAAAAAQESWAKVPARERGEILRRAFELVTERAEDFALLMTLEMGKPLAEARGEVTYGAEFLRWFSEEAVRAFGRYSVSPDGKSRLLVTKKPVGPCLLITPWNFPLAMATRKIAPAVAAGCTMVLKSANLTPLTSQLFAAVMMEAGLPAGVLNVIPTSTAGATHGSADQGSAPAEAVLHRFHRGRPPAARRRLRDGPADLDGTRRQRPVRGVRGRRRRCRRRRGDAGEAAEHGRGLHRGEPVHRARVRRGGVRGEVRREDGGHDHGPGHRGRVQGRPADRCQEPGQGPRTRHRRRERRCRR